MPVLARMSSLLKLNLVEGVGSKIKLMVAGDSWGDALFRSFEVAVCGYDCNFFGRVFED